MGLQRWLSWTLPVLAAGVVAVGVIGAEEVPPDIQALPADTLETVAAPEPAEIAQQPVGLDQEVVVEQAAVADEAVVLEEAVDAAETAPPEVSPQPETVAAHTEVALETASSLTLAPAAVPPRSQQTLVDERRDLLRQRRNAMLDSFGGGRGYMSPDLAAYNDAVERRRDAWRRSYRQQRDQRMLRRDGWMDAMCPWSKPQRDRSRQRSFQMQMEQLERRAARDAWLYGQQPYAPAGLASW